MQLQLSTWQDVEAYLSRSSGIILPIGSTEQHGPTGLIGTDALTAEAVADGVGKACDALVAPTISVGMAQHHMAFPGSMTLMPSTLVALVRDYVVSLARHGFTRFFFINGHGGNIATLNAAFNEVYAQSSLMADARGGLRCKVANWFLAPGVSALAKELYGHAEGSHATPSEVSLTMFTHADAVRNRALEPKIAPNGPIYDALDYRRRFPDGRIGSAPELASGEDGKRFYDTAVAELAEKYRAFLTAQ